jgi:hypothetical protein
LHDGPGIAVCGLCFKAPAGVALTSGYKAVTITSNQKKQNDTPSIFIAVCGLHFKALDGVALTSGYKAVTITSNQQAK